MNRFLGPESKFYEAISLLADLVILNVLLIVSSFPVFTGGMALRTAHEVMGQMVRDEGSHRALTYLRGLTVRPGVNTAWWLLCLAAGALGAYELWVMGRAGLADAAVLVLRAAITSGLLVLGLITVWFFHLDPQGPEGFRRRFIVSANRAIAQLPRTALALLPWLVLAFFPLFVPSQLGAYIFFVATIGPALAVYLSELALQWETGT